MQLWNPKSKIFTEYLIKIYYYSIRFREIAMKHSDKSVLESAFVTLSKLCDTKYTIYPKCDVVRVNLLDMVANNFR